MKKYLSALLVIVVGLLFITYSPGCKKMEYVTSTTSDLNIYSYLKANPDKYSSYQKLFPLGETKIIVLKYPYLRRSYITKRKVSDIIIETLPETAVLAFSSITFGAFFGILIGIFSAVKKNSFFQLADKSCHTHK